MLAALYDKNSPQYHHWLTTGQFDARYAPTPAARTAVAKYLSSSGLTVVPSGSPFLVRATGSSAQIQRTFHTTLNTFKDSHGTKYFANSTPVYMPSAIAGSALGVIGLTNTVRDAPHAKPLQEHAAQARQGVGDDQLRDRLSRPSSSCSPSSTTGPLPLRLRRRPRLQRPDPVPGQLALRRAQPRRERPRARASTSRCSSCRPTSTPTSRTWAHQFYGPGYTPPLVDVNVDGGPLTPQCPSRRHVPAGVQRLLRRHRGRRRHRDAAGHRARRQPPDRLQRAERLHRPDRARRVVRDRQGQRGRLGQLELGRLRERHRPPATPRPRTPSSGRWPRRGRACSGPKVTPAPSRASAPTAPPSSTFSTRPLSPG